MTSVLVNNIDHAGLRVAIRTGAAHGDSVNQLPLYPSEFEEAQRSFPIVFRRTDEGIQAFALLGLDRDENLFLDGDRWTTPYIPAMQRRGPFSIGMTPPALAGDAAGEPMIHIDMDDARVGAPDGLPLFLEQGGNAPLLDHIAGVLRVLFTGVTQGPAMLAELEAAGLLQPTTLQISVTEQDRYDVPDLLMIDQDALAALAGDRLERLHETGLLRAATMAAASIGNVQRLIDLKADRLGAAR